MNKLSYEEYIKLGIGLINNIINKTDYTYESDNYEHREGRLNSIKGENDLITSIIESDWDKIDENDTYFYFYNKKLDSVLVIPHSARSWFDLGIIHKECFFPINIKITNGNTADNLFGVKVLNYLLFGEYELDQYGTHLATNKDEIKVAEGISNFLQKNKLHNKNLFNLGENIDFNQTFNTALVRDYFFLSINKTDNSIKIIPFLNIEYDYIKTNPKNAFQINLSILEQQLSNDIYFDYNIKKLIYKYYEYIEKKAQPYLLISGKL